MNRSWVKLIVGVFSVGVLAIILTLASLYYVRESGELAYWCDGPECLRPVKSAGLPFGYIYDVPGISLENSIGIEDDWRWSGFVLNVGTYFAVLSAVAVALALRARPRSP